MEGVQLMQLSQDVNLCVFNTFLNKHISVKNMRIWSLIMRLKKESGNRGGKLLLGKRVG